MIDLEERFTEPKGRKTGTFTNPLTRHTIHFASVAAEHPEAIVVGLGGLSEFSEKFHEFSRDMLARNYAFWTMDWAYQGRSSRLPANKWQRRHSDGVEADLADLHKFMTEHVRPASALPDGKHLPVILVAHSMGAMIGLRYLSEHAGIFNAAAFSAPMLGIPMAGWQRALLKILHAIRVMDQEYVPTMGKDWDEKRRTGPDQQIFSSDSLRDGLHRNWSIADEKLRVGDPTIGWIAKSLESFKAMARPDYIEKIDIPVMVAIAGDEKIVSNNATLDILRRLPKGDVLELEGARHEILVEADLHRKRFLDRFDKMLKENNIVPSSQPA